MPNILSRLPFYDKSDYLRDLHGKVITLGGQPIKIKAFQIVVWVGLSSSPEALDANAPRLPAVLDTGYTGYFSIQANQLHKWAGLAPDSLESLGTTEINEIQVPSRSAAVWLQPNLPGNRALYLGSEPVLLEGGSAGITVYPSGGKDPRGKDYPRAYPRLPVVGMRALTLNSSRLSIDSPDVTSLFDGDRGSHGGRELSVGVTRHASMDPRA